MGKTLEDFKAGAKLPMHLDGAPYNALRQSV